jgi:TolB-like protein/class 3 adenylate cyclase
VQRRLAAILAADVVGYSRLMADDEEATLAALKGHREELIAPLVSDHRGRVVKLMGDGLLAEFASVVDATQCAIAIQQGMSRRNRDEAEARRMALRIGINIGDIVIEDQDIYGDGVNVAARLEALAEPGGILVSGDAYRQVHNKLKVSFDYLGENTLRNIPTPVETYRVIDGAQAVDDRPADMPAAATRAASPSIAVLPFVNVAGAPEDEYFCDGIAEDLITALSNVRSFFVIDRSSSFTFKGQSTEVKEIGRRLGVRYVLEGSLRKARDRVRVSAQLVEAETGKHVWADRFDGDLEDVFDLQDQIVASVVGALEPQMLRVELDRIHRKRPENFDAYDLTLCGLSHMNKLTAQDTATALDYFRRAIEADPGYARAYAMAAWCYRRRVYLRGMILSEEEKNECLRLARAALQIDNTDPYVLWHAGFAVALVEQDIDSGLSLIDRSLAANPNSNRALLSSGIVRCHSVDPRAAIEQAERAMQMSPLDVAMWVAYGVLATAHVQLGNYEEAAVWARRSVQMHRDHLPAHLALIASLAQTGRLREAETAVAELLEMEPGLSVKAVRQRFQIDRYQNLDGFMEGLGKAGMPA